MENVKRFTIISLIILFGCTATETIPIIITPTPDATSAIPSTPLPELTEEVIAQARTNTPTVTRTPPAPESDTPTNVPSTPIMTYGPVIGPGYQSPTPDVAPPTETPEALPTQTSPPARPTDSPGPSNTPGPTPTPVPALDADQMGIQLYTNMGFDSWMQVIGLAQQTGVRWAKVQVNWAFLQPEGPNQFNDSMLLFERQIEALNRAGFNVMLSIAKAPDWARSTIEEDGPPNDPQALADFIQFMLNDTKIGGVTDAIEVWNEPNLIREWRGALPFNGAGYMQLFRPSYDVIRQYSPGMTIITAGLAPTSNIGNVAIDDRVFLQQMYDAGLGAYNDVVIGAHPYGWGNPPDFRCCDNIAGQAWDDDPHFFFLENLEATYTIMRQNGDDGVQIWVTEFGWATWEGLPSDPPEEWVNYNTANEQADYGIRAFEIGQDLPYVGPMILWNLNFANSFLVENSNEVAGYSIINPVIFPSERPLYWALSQATGGNTTP
jgi:polysaccharide biosynthesis protein PslG